MIKLLESGMKYSMDKKFSIIIPNYNKEEYIEEKREDGHLTF